jgi:hypothetical protein
VRTSEALRDQDEITRPLRDVEKRIEMLLERIIEAEHARVIKAYQREQDREARAREAAIGRET